jgi:YHS domain-containing protein
MLNAPPRQSFAAPVESIEQEEPMPIDPVCKMHVNVSDAAASYDYHSETVYFCSVECEKEFEKDPDLYMGGMSDEEQVAS